MLITLGLHSLHSLKFSVNYFGATLFAQFKFSTLGLHSLHSLKFSVNYLAAHLCACALLFYINTQLVMSYGQASTDHCPYSSLSETLASFLATCSNIPGSQILLYRYAMVWDRVHTLNFDVIRCTYTFPIHTCI